MTGAICMLYKIVAGHTPYYTWNGISHWKHLFWVMRMSPAKSKNFPTGPSFLFCCFWIPWLVTLSLPMLSSSNSKHPLSPLTPAPPAPMVNGRGCQWCLGPRVSTSNAHICQFTWHVQIFSRVYWQGLELKSLRESNCPCSVRMVFPKVDGAQDIKRSYVNKGFHGQ